MARRSNRRWRQPAAVAERCPWASIDDWMVIPMIRLRKLLADDVATIAGWPAYPPEFEDLDYSLRNQGWLAEYSQRPNTWIFAVEQSGRLIAFTILSKTRDTEAEFRIALRADVIGQGLGGIITTETLAKGFGEIGLSRIHLIVRKNNPRAIRLYRRLGFTERGECWKVINEKCVHFLEMDVLRECCATHPMSKA